MSLQATLSLFILLSAALISAGLAWYTWQHRQTVGATPFSILMLILFQWCFSYFLQLTTTDLATKTFWNKVTFLGVVSTPVLWFLFALEYTGRKNWITRLRLIALFVVPLITTIIIWTNDSHQLFWAHQELRLENDLILLDASNGFWFWVHAAYSYILILTGTVFIVRALLRWPAQYRGQMAWILFAVAAPWLANAVTVFKLLPIVIDLTPFAFTVTGIGMAFALFRHRLLELVPIARDVVFEEMTDGMIVLDANDRVVDINQAARKILRLSGKQQPIGKSMGELFVHWPHLIARYIHTNQAHEEITLGKGKNQRWISLNISPLQDRKKKSVGRLALIRDITARKMAEQQLRQLSRAVEASPTSIVITDINGNIQYVNPKFTQVTGYRLEEVLGKNPNILKSDQTPVGTHSDLWKTISSGQEWRGEFCNRKKNGELYWEIASISPIESSEGAITHYVAVKEDITERKHTERLLQESEERFRQIVEHASDFIYRTDAEGYFTYANPAALRITGFEDEKEVIGKHYTELTIPEERYRLKRTYQRQYISKTPNTYNEFPVATKDGRELWFGQNVQLLMEGDQVTGFQILARDITDVKRAQEALRISYDQAMEASRAKSQLLANVSHELRTPLGGILGYAELLKNGAFGPLVDDQKHATEEILQSVQYLTAMVNELLDEAQIQARTTSIQEKPFSPATLLQQATAGTQVLAQRKGLDFTTYIDENLPEELYGDDRRLRQILTNLIGNAIKFTSKGEVEVRLEYPDLEHWAIRVTDTGMGIPLDAQSSIFDPFKQADNAITRDNRGIGLGLSITKQLVELMGGRIMLESQVGQGSTFSVLLPIAYPPEDETDIFTVRGSHDQTARVDR